MQITNGEYKPCDMQISVELFLSAVRIHMDNCYIFSVRNVATSSV